MSYEYAAFFRLLLLCGYSDDMERYLDTALAEQDPLTDIVLELAWAGSDGKKKLSALNSYLRQIKDSDIDYNGSVFWLVMAFLKRKYLEDAMSMKDLTDLMCRIAVHTERYFDEPWSTMYFIGESFAEAENGFIDKNDFQRGFDAFINDPVCFRAYPSAPPKESLFKRLMRRIRCCR